MEAGIEHLGRGTAECVDMMIVVSDANKKSLAVAGTIARMALGAGIPRVQLVGNRIETVAHEDLITLFAQEHKIPVLGFVPYDPEVFRAGIAGEPIQSLQGTPAIRSIEEITHKITQITYSKI
jgi:CO dehydrogenase maturation factor